jgi:hypothetical protein
MYSVIASNIRDPNPDYNQLTINASNPDSFRVVPAGQRKEVQFAASKL